MTLAVDSFCERGNWWLRRYEGKPPIFACILGFTATGLIEGISAAGATPAARRYTAIADAEFLLHGVRPSPRFRLPPLDFGVSPVFISRAVVEGCQIPVFVLDAGLPEPAAVEVRSLGGRPARCLTSGRALPLATVKHLFAQGLRWGEQLATEAGDGYLIVSECVVGGTTTALAVLTALGIEAAGKVNSSHPRCNHEQKWEVVQAGLRKSGLLPEMIGKSRDFVDPLEIIAAVGDPMQVVAAGMAIAASRSCGVLLAGGTQMFAVYALAKKIVSYYQLEWRPKQVVVGTTSWVVLDSTGDTLGLAKDLEDLSLLATQLSFAQSGYAQLQIYERGYVKEGVGAGGAAIAASLYRGWTSRQLLDSIEALVKSYQICIAEMENY
ncbi:MAG: TIGR00303 family protein [Oscillatoria sp. PMC 1068.18]|nr:TIGR00303 family protein [Oscillatoria sp. PMC 1076.18]MEC4988825.1 TIGR00303 family protein [Oscillatoria sp. PMC 1068.18]